MSKKSGSLARTLPNATSRKGNRSQTVRIRRPRDTSKIKCFKYKRVIGVEDDSNTDGIAIEETVQAKHVTEKGIISSETDGDFDYRIRNENKGICTSTSNARETCTQSTQVTQTCLHHIRNGDAVNLASSNSPNSSKDSKLSWMASPSNRRKTPKINCVKTYSRKDMTRQTKDEEDSMSSKEKVENWLRHCEDNAAVGSLPRSPDKQGVKNTLKRSSMPIKLKSHTLASISRSPGLFDQENSPYPNKRKRVRKMPNRKRVLNDINSPNMKCRRESEDSDDPVPNPKSKKSAKKGRFYKRFREAGRDEIEVLKEELAAAESFDLEVETRGSSKKPEESIAHGWEIGGVPKEHASSPVCNTATETHRRGDHQLFN